MTPRAAAGTAPELRVSAPCCGPPDLPEARGRRVQFYPRGFDRFAPSPAGFAKRLRREWRAPRPSESAAGRSESRAREFRPGDTLLRLTRPNKYILREAPGRRAREFSAPDSGRRETNRVGRIGARARWDKSVRPQQGDES